MNNNKHNINNKVFKNPYSPQYPASPEYFADRSEAIVYFSKTVLNCARLKPPSPVNFIVLGDWGIGKTSLMYKMEQVVLTNLSRKISAFCFHLSLDPTTCKDWDKFCSEFLNQLRRNFTATKGLKEKIRSQIKKWEISFTIPPVSVRRKRSFALPSFSDSLETLWKKHLENSGIDMALLFLDDIHYFMQVGQSDAYFALRNAFQELARRGCNFSLILSGPRLLFTEMVDLAEPFIRFFHPFYLESFELEGTKEAILKRISVNQLRLKLADDVIFRIHEKTEGHPYFVMFVMYELLNALRGEGHITLIDFERHWTSIASSLENTVFIGHLGRASEKEREILRKIAFLDEMIVSPSMIKGLKGTSMLFSRLERKGLLIKEERGKYKLFHPLFKEYLKKS